MNSGDLSNRGNASSWPLVALVRSGRDGPPTSHSCLAGWPTQYVTGAIMRVADPVNSRIQSAILKLFELIYVPSLAWSFENRKSFASVASCSWNVYFWGILREPFYMTFQNFQFYVEYIAAKVIHSYCDTSHYREASVLLLIIYKLVSFLLLQEL